MSQNLIEVAFTAEQLARIDAVLGELETLCAPLIALTPGQRRELNKMGDKSEAFCRQATATVLQYRELLPRNFDVDGMAADLTAIDVLRPRLLRLERLRQRALDTTTALGSDLMVNALEGYGMLKIVGRGEGLDAARKTLGARFSRGPRRKPSEAAAEPA